MDKTVLIIGAMVLIFVAVLGGSYIIPQMQTVGVSGKWHHCNYNLPTAYCCEVTSNYIDVPAGDIFDTKTECELGVESSSSGPKCMGPDQLCNDAQLIGGSWLCSPDDITYCTCLNDKCVEPTCAAYGSLPKSKVGDRHCNGLVLKECTSNGWSTVTTCPVACTDLGGTTASCTGLAQNEFCWSSASQSCISCSSGYDTEAQCESAHEVCYCLVYTQAAYPGSGQCVRKTGTDCSANNCYSTGSEQGSLDYCMRYVPTNASQGSQLSGQSGSEYAYHCESNKIMRCSTGIVKLCSPVDTCINPKYCLDGLSTCQIGVFSNFTDNAKVATKLSPGIARPEIKALTSPALLKYSCVYPQDCQDGSKCESFASLIASGDMTIEQKNTFYSTLKTTLTGAGIGVGVGTVVGTGACIALAAASGAASGGLAAIPVASLCTGLVIGGAGVGATIGGVYGYGAADYYTSIQNEDASKTGVCVIEESGTTADLFKSVDNWVKSLLPDNAKQYSGLLILAFIVIVILALIAPRR